MEEKSICAKCGGKCCKGTPGLFLPEDISPTLDPQELFFNLSEMIASGDYDFYKHKVYGFHSEYVLVPKPRVVGNKELTADWYRGAFGDCKMLTPTGCKLSNDKRPSECKALIPDESFECENTTLDRNDIYERWKPFFNVVLRVYVNAMKDKIS